eukprot:2603633-Rhodomonas_salina.1
MFKDRKTVMLVKDIFHPSKVGGWPCVCNSTSDKVEAAMKCKQRESERGRDGEEGREGAKEAGIERESARARSLMAGQIRPSA